MNAILKGLMVPIAVLSVPIDYVGWNYFIAPARKFGRITWRECIRDSLIHWRGL